MSDSNSSSNESNTKTSTTTVGKFPLDRTSVLKWNGWGYSDSGFTLTNNTLTFHGNRYMPGTTTSTSLLALPSFTSWVQSVLGADFTSPPTLPSPLPSTYPSPTLNPSFIHDLGPIRHSTSGQIRLFRSHGHTLKDIYKLRTGTWSRIPDLVIFPECHQDVVNIVSAANQVNRGQGSPRILLIPFGGGTSVTGGLSCEGTREDVSVVAVDLSQMNRVLQLDTDNLSVTCESGIVGQFLERELRGQGYTTGHEPDSYEFSSLGGWVATRASGMKKNTYGNIEDLLLHTKMVTGIGTVQRNTNSNVPRLSAGPDIQHVVLGSEGTLGIITEATLKIRPLPPLKKYGSIVFPDFETGVCFMRELARLQLQPSSVRLMDNGQFKFGQSLKPQSGLFTSLKDTLKKLYLQKYKKLDMDSITVTTLLYEGTGESVLAQEKKVLQLALKLGGLNAGSGSGELGYLLTFIIAYIRDIGLDYRIVAESFETSVPWNKTLQLCSNVKSRVDRESKAHGLEHWFVTCRVTQTYASGSCVYFYYAFNYSGLPESVNPIQLFEEIEESARDEIIRNGGSISHHHGVGRIRTQFMTQTLSTPAILTLRNIKTNMDPHNVFNSFNLLPTHTSLLKSKL